MIKAEELLTFKECLMWLNGFSWEEILSTREEADNDNS
jgi:hypothetical protein